MPGSKNATPEVVLARTLEKAKAGLIKGVIVAIVWDDDGVSSDHSTMKVSQSLLALRVAQDDIDSLIFSAENLESVPGDV